MRKIVLEGKSIDHLKFYLKNDIKLLKKVFELFHAIQSDPLKELENQSLYMENLGYWSRRINEEHRIVHTVTI